MIKGNSITDLKCIQIFTTYSYLRLLSLRLHSRNELSNIHKLMTFFFVWIIHNSTLSADSIFLLKALGKILKSLKKNENQGINVHENHKTEEGRLLIHEK